MTMRTRFAPSPTGFLHIGGARTALFSHLHTRRHGGTTVLRIEDTDRERSTPEATRAILEGLHWLGLDADEGPYFQSDRTERHLETAHRLLEAGKAYRCFCTREELDALREAQRERNEKPRYDGRCRARSDHPDLPHVIRLVTPQEGETVWDDMIQGTIRIANQELDDLILVRSDGSPTFHLAVVTDDHDMGITHVIRGEDHLSNTPRQIHLFQAMGWPIPHYAHMPLLHGTDGAKLSKRHGAVSVLQYRLDGFLPEAVNNYLARLGWSHGDQEFFSMEELCGLFEVTEVGRSAAIFNLSKLVWLNGQHMQRTPPEQLLPELLFQLERLGVAPVDPALALAVIPLYRERAKTLVEMAEKSLYCFRDTLTYDDKAVRKHFQEEARVSYDRMLARLTATAAWEMHGLEALLREVVAEAGLGMGKLAQPVRVALTGSDVSPGIFDLLVLLGRERSLARLQQAARFFASTPDRES